MKLRELAYLADENFDPGVIAHLRGAGWDIQSASELGLLGRSDAEVLSAAHRGDRALLTHDGDFGGLAVVGREPVVGIIYIRPGHISSAFTIATLDALIRRDPDVRPPFILVARRKDDDVTIRIRPL